MSIIVPTSIEVAVLEYLLETADLVLRLFSNNYEPSEDAIVASFTEVSGGGYAPITLDKDNWIIDTGVATIAHQTAQTFTFTGTIGGSGVVYGYYVTDTTGTVLYWAESLPGSISPFTPNNGAYIRITPKYQAS